MDTLNRMKLIKQPIRLPTEFTVPLSSIKSRDRLIAKSKQIEDIHLPEVRDIVARNNQELQRCIKDAEAVCKPILKAIKAAGDAVRKLRDDFIAPASMEKARGERMLVKDREREEERVRVEQAARQAEIERLNALQRAAEQKATEDTPEALQAEMEAHDMANAMESLILSPPPEPAKPKGVAMKQRMRVEVLDVHALYAARPDLVRLEANLSEIQRVCVPEIQIPGIRTWWETCAETRAA